jgi:hypothetical protein
MTTTYFYIRKTRNSHSKRQARTTSKGNASFSKPHKKQQNKIIFHITNTKILKTKPKMIFNITKNTQANRLLGGFFCKFSAFIIMIPSIIICIKSNTCHPALSFSSHSLFLPLSLSLSLSLFLSLFSLLSLLLSLSLLSSSLSFMYQQRCMLRFFKFKKNKSIQQGVLSCRFY